jgi:ABC-2 type transport system ATP-binding protein
MTNPVIEISNLHKAYGALRVLRGVNLQIAPGEVFGLLGPNGAGKTTLNHTILGLLKPDRGAVKVFGSTNTGDGSANVGYLPERQRYHPHFTGREYLTTLGKLSGLGGKQLTQHVAAVLNAMGLADAANRRLGTYSKGMLQRIGLAQAILHDPDLLIIDEPTSGLDPGGQQEMLALLHQLRQAGHTIFMCTHQLANVTSLCDRVGVLVNGQINHIADVVELEAQGHSVVIDAADLPLDTP